MGMELALLVLFVVFACSVLLVSSAMLGKSNLNDRKDKMAERLGLDAYAEQVLSGQEPEDETYEYEKMTNALVIKDRQSGQEKLRVIWNDGKITKWQYS